MIIIKLKIIGMHCSSCALSIDFDLEDMKGVISAKTNYSKSETTVEFDGTKTSINKIRDCIKSAGYTSSTPP